ncbi:MAG: hypothetical protein MJ064_09145 [Lachnospiraceae bacterium]|nr:hypothetical protein [Lachnospiraceae bacterium]
MRAQKRILFRYPAQDVLLLGTYIIACTLIIGFSVCTEKMRMHREAKHPYASQAKFCTQGIIAGLDEVVIDELMQCSYGNLFANAKVYDTYNEGYHADVLLKQNEPLKYAFRELLIEQQEFYSVENAVLLGSAWRGRTEIKDGLEYLVIGDLYMRVVAYIENYSFLSDDMSLIVLWKTFTDDAKKKFSFGPEYIELDSVRVYSDSVDSASQNRWADYFYQILVRAEKRKYARREGDWADIPVGQFEILIFEDNQLAYVDAWYQNYQRFVFPFSILFSVILCCYAMTHWLKKRNYECAVRMGFGYTKKQISAMLVKTMGVYVFLSVAIAFVPAMLVFGADVSLVFHTDSLLRLIAGILLLVLVFSARILFWNRDVLRGLGRG